MNTSAGSKGDEHAAAAAEQQRRGDQKPPQSSAKKLRKLARKVLPYPAGDG